MCFTDGTCRPNDCATVTCPQGSYCMGGRCLDSCAGAVCPGGGACMGGRCFPPVGDGGTTTDGGASDASADVPSSTDSGVTRDAGLDGGDASLQINPEEDTGCSCRAGSSRPLDGRFAVAGVAVAMSAFARRRRRR